MALQSLLDTDENVFLPAGTYAISKTLTLKDGTTIAGEAGTRLVMNGAGDVFRASGKLKGGLLVRASHFRFRDITIVAKDIVKNRHAVRMDSVEDVRLERVETIGLGGLRINTTYPVNVWDKTPDPPATAGMTGDECLSSNIVVRSCRFDGGKRGMGCGVDISYATVIDVRDSVAINLSHGFQFWGGDSFHERGGRLENDKRLKKLVVANCRAVNVSGGGIWATMAENILVTNCSATLCLDVGIDFEGCHKAEAVNCSVRDCRNGNYSTFMFCTRDVAFRHCFSELTGEFPYTCHFFNSNSTQRKGEQCITLEDCVFTSNRPSLVRVQSAAREFRFVGNMCTNVIFDPRATNMGKVVCERNKFVPAVQ